MKILMLSARFEPRGLGGAERAARTLAAHVRDLGHEVVVLTTAVGDDAGDRVVDGIRVHSIPLRNVYDLGESASAPLLKPVWHLIDAFNPAMQSAVARVIADERPDIVHSHLLTGFSAAAWSAARRAGLPVVHTLHDHYVVCARSTMTLAGVPCEARHLECALLTRPRVHASLAITRVVGVSEYILARHRQYGAFEGVAGVVIPNPCHLVGAGLSPSGAPGPLRLGFMGRLEPVKGIELLLRAAPALIGRGSLRVAGVGDPEYVASLRRQAAGLPVEFVGTVEPGTFLRDVDLMVVPSLVPESFGLSAAEALATGVPVVVSNRGALPELVQDGRNGFVFDPAVDGGLEITLRNAIASRDRLRAMAEDCRQSVAALSPGAVAARYDAVYREAAAARPR